MVTLSFLLLFFAIACAFYLAWNIGANDVANAMGTSVGSGAITIRRALFVAGIFEFLGACCFGKGVTNTLEYNTIKIPLFEPRTLIVSMCITLAATGGWLHIASFFRWPVSTTHAIVGSLVGVGYAVHGWEGVYWHSLLSIGASWVLSPFLACIIAWVLFQWVQKVIFSSWHPLKAMRWFMPLLAWSLMMILLFCLHIIGSAVTFLLCSLFVTLGSLGLTLWWVRKEHVEDKLEYPSHLLALKKAVQDLERVSMSMEEREEAIDQILMRTQNLHKKQTEKYQGCSSTFSSVERGFAILQMCSACLVAFAHGSNDIANSIAPLKVVISLLFDVRNFALDEALLVFGGLSIVLGLATWGWRVIETVGKKITLLTPSRGFCAEFATASTILLASWVGIPLSTTHSLVGALVGVGWAYGWSSVNLSVVWQILFSWIVTIPCSFFMSASLIHLFR